MLELLGVLAAGVATLATPCVLPLVPIYLAMLMGGSLDAARDPRSRGRLMLLTVAFALGFISVFTALGLGASSLGAVLSRHRMELQAAGAGVIALLGLSFLDVLKVPLLQRDVRLSSPRKIDGAAGGFAFGVVFALGWTPCAGPVLGSVLSYAALTGDTARGALLLSTYGLGMALPLVAIAAFADRALPLLRRLMRVLPTLQRVTGTFMLLLGAWLGGTAAWDLRRASLAETGAPSAVNQHGTLVSPLLGMPLERPRLVELVDEGCTVCQRMMARVEELQGNCTQQVDVEVVPLSNPANATLRSSLAVRAVPTILLVNDQGVVVASLVGERTLEELRGLAAGLQSEPCQGVAPLDAQALPQGSKCPSASDGNPGTCG